MKTLVRKLFIFSLPFAVYAVVVVVIDPFDFFNVCHLISDETKQRLSYRLNYRLWKMTAYRRQPSSNILLGDSRMEHLNVDYLRHRTGQEWANLAYGGASMAEILERFHYADNHTHLTNVCIGLNFNLFDRHKTNNQVRQVLSYQQNPLLYLCDRVVLKACVLLLFDGVFGSVDNVETPPMDHDDFWVHQLEVTTQEVCRRYEYAPEFADSLRGIIAYCRDKRIAVNFIIFPEHEDLVARYSLYGREQEYRRFQDEIPALTRTYDFAARREIIGNKELFSDPYHTINEVYLGIIDEIW